MGKNSNITWTHHTFNPWWGCTKRQGRPACLHCYAEQQAGRFGVYWGEGAPRRFFDAQHWNEPLRWNAQCRRKGIRQRVFAGSMCDIFDHEVAQVHRAQLWELIIATPYLDWLLLTKRIECADSMVPHAWATDRLPANVWLGTTVENQVVADQVVPWLLGWRQRADVLFVSCEPLCGPLTLAPYLGQQEGGALDWVITGGESGNQARPGNSDWFRALRDECLATSTRFFFKQWGEWIDAGHQLFGRTITSPASAEPIDVPVTFITSAGRRLAYPPRDENADVITMRRVGKALAGDLLDGRVWHQVPRYSEVSV